MPLPSSIKTNKTSLLNITSIKMSESIYDQLSDEEKAALTYAIVFPHQTLKIILPELFNTSWYSGLYKCHSRGRENLKERRFLDDKGNPTDLGFGILPAEKNGERFEQRGKEGILRTIQNGIREIWIRGEMQESKDQK